MRTPCWWKPADMTCKAYFEAAKLANGTLVPLTDAPALDHSVKRDNHDTGAAEKWRSFYDQEMADLVYELYQPDFERFGYPRLELAARAAKSTAPKRLELATEREAARVQPFSNASTTTPLSSPAQSAAPPGVQGASSAKPRGDAIAAPGGDTTAANRSSGVAVNGTLPPSGKRGVRSSDGPHSHTAAIVAFWQAWRGN